MLVGGWSVVYASSKADVVLKFPLAVRKKYRGESEHFLEHERKVLENLPPACRLITPRFYGTYQWPGGRALALSYGGH